MPQVATAWTIRRRHEIEFEIRADIKFHDGTPLTAEDVVFSVQRITDPAFKSPQLSPVRQIVAAEVAQPDKVRLKHQDALSGAARPARQALDRAEGPCREGRRPEDSTSSRWERALSAGELAEGRARHARGQRQLLARQAAVPARVTSASVPDVATRIADLRTGKADIVRAA